MLYNGKKVNRILSILFAVIVLSTFFGSISQAGEINPELQEILAGLKNGDEVGVIIEMMAKADLKSRPNKPDKLRELRDVASKSQGQMLGKLERDKEKGKVKKYKSFWIFNGLAVIATKTEILELAEDPGVKEIRLDKVIQIPPVVMEPSGAEWNIEKVRAPQVWKELGITGKGVVVANMDTGVDYLHPDLAAQYRGGFNSWHDSVNGIPEPYDDNGHGTHTMGTICGRDKGGTAIGVAWDATWIATKALDQWGSGDTSWIHDSFEWLADPDGDPNTDDAPQVINNSWGNDDGKDTEFLSDVENLNDLGIFTVFANCNAGPSPGTVGSPASFSFGVGATDIDDMIADFSSRGPSPIDGSIKPNVSAPGVAVLSSLPGGGYGFGWGTSMATPHVAGAAALLLEADPFLTIDELANLLMDTAVDLGSAGPDNDYGWGRIDAYEAVSMVAHGGTLAGMVKDADTGAPLSATVTLLEIGREADTEPATGWYSLRAPEGTYTAQAEALSYPPQIAIVTIIEGMTMIQDFALSLVDPEIEVSTDLIEMTLVSGEKDDAEFMISNVGPPGSELAFGIQEGLLAQEIPWLKADPDEGLVKAGDSASIRVGFDATGMSSGVYGADLMISHNDGGNAMKNVHVVLTVLEPDIAIAPDKFDVKVEYNKTRQETMTISNKGDGMLWFEIEEEIVPPPGKVESTHATDKISSEKYPNQKPKAEAVGPHQSPIPPLEIPSGTPPVLDGAMSPGEWDDAVSVSVTPIIDPNGAEMGKIYVKSTGQNLYVLIDQHTQSGIDVDITGDVWFDLDNNGSNDGGVMTEVWSGNVSRYFDYPAKSEVGESPTPSNPSPHWIFEYEIPLDGIGMSTGSLFGIHFVLYNYFDYAQAGEWYNSTNDFDYYYPDTWADVRLADWLTVEPKDGKLGPGESIPIAITFDATGLRNGDYLAELLVENNDPDTPKVKVPVRMEVFGFLQPIISVKPAEFKEIISGWKVVEREMEISNLGNIPLEFMVKDPVDWLSEDPTEGKVEPGDTIVVKVIFDTNGLEDGEYKGEIKGVCNDPDRPDVRVPVDLKVINAPKPDIDVKPLSFAETLPDDYVKTLKMTIANTAALAPLNFTIVDTPPLGDLPKVENNEPFSVQTGGVDRTQVHEQVAGPPVTQGLGGPDAFGYKWIDSDEPGGPVYDWIDISGIGEQLKIDGLDVVIGPLDIGFDFPFYGRMYDRFYFCTHGFITFSPTIPQYWNTPLPYFDAPGNMIAPFWTDLCFPCDGWRGEAYYWSDGKGTLIVSYHDVPSTILGGGSYNFQVILSSNGLIIFQYRKMQPPFDWYTVGIQNADRDIGLQVAYNTMYVHDELAVAIVPDVPWLTERPSFGTVMPGESKDIDVIIDTHGLDPGTDHEAWIAIVSNDPDESPWIVPLSLKVRRPMLSLVPSEKEVTVGQPFDVEVILDTQGFEVNCASVYLSFDDTFLEAVGSKSGGPFEPGSFMGGTVLENDTHGDPGNDLPGLQLDYSEGMPDATVNGKGTLASFKLSPRGMPSGAEAIVPIVFDFDISNGRGTGVSADFVTESPYILMPIVSSPAAVITIKKKDGGMATWDISGEVPLQGRKDHSAVVSFTLLKPDDTKPLDGRKLKTNSKGAFTFDKVPAGTYIMMAKEHHYLQGISKPVTIPPSAKNVGFGYDTFQAPDYTLRGGDCDSNNMVDIADLSILALFFGQKTEPMEWPPEPWKPPTPWHADIDGSGMVDLTDFSIIASNFGECGVPLPWEEKAAPPTSITMSANFGGAFRMYPSTGSRIDEGTYGVYLDEDFDVQVIAEGVTDARGCSFDLEYDPFALQLIEDEGQVASEGAFLKQARPGRSTLFLSQVNEDTHPQMRGVTIAASMIGSQPGASGDGPLASLRFRVVDKQPSLVALRKVVVIDSEGNKDRLPDVTLTIRPIPRKPRFAQNYPNPFNPETWIPFELSEEARVVVRIYMTNGQLIRTLDLGMKSPGFYVDRQQAAYWDGKTEAGEQVASGVYFYTTQAGGFTATKKMVVVR